MSSKSKSVTPSKSKDKKEKEKEKEKDKHSHSHSTATASASATSSSSSSSPPITSTTPNKIATSSSNSFLYWKQKESSSKELLSSSFNKNEKIDSNIDDNLSNSSLTSPPTSNNTSPKPQTPTKKSTLFSLGKKSGAEYLNAISPDNNNNNITDSSKKNSSNTTSTTTNSSKEKEKDQYSTLRMKSESRKSIKIFGLELFGKSEMEEETSAESSPQPSPTITSTSSPTITSTNGLAKSVQPTSTSKKSTPISTPPLTSSTPNISPSSSSPTKSSMKQSSKSSLAVGSGSAGVNSARKGSSPQPVTTSSTLSSSPTMSSTAPPVKPVLVSPKKVSPLQSATAGTQSSGNSSPLSSSPLIEGGFDDPFKNDVMLADDLDLSKLNPKHKNKAVERLLQLELITKILSKEVEGLAGKLTNEISARREVESHYKELETRLQVYEARWKRYSSSATQEDPRVHEEDEKIRVFREEHESQRITTLLTRIDTLEKKVQSLEQNNRLLNEEIFDLQTESALSASDKKKKLKKEQKEKEKEKEHEKELAKEHKEKLKEAEKLKERERKEAERLKKKMRKIGTLNGLESETYSRESSVLDSADELSQVEPKKVVNDTTSEGGDLGTSFERKKRVIFGDDQDILNKLDSEKPHHASSKSSTSGYVTLRKNAAKRLSAHISGTKGLLDDDIDSLKKYVNDQNLTSEEKSKKVKGFFNDYYLDYNDIINEKKTRMRSKSLSKEKEEEEKIGATNFMFSNSTGSITGSITSSKRDDDLDDLDTESQSSTTTTPRVSLTSSFDPKVNQSELSHTPPVTTTSTPTTSTPTTTTPVLRSANEKKKTNTGYLTLGRMFKKDDTISILSDKLKDRKTRDELISNNIIKVSIFGTEITEDLYSLISEFFNQTFKCLLDHRDLDDLFKKDVEESAIHQFIEEIDGKVQSDFDKKDPYLVATTLIQYLSKLPTAILARITTPLIHSIEFTVDAYRRAIIRSQLFSLPVPQRMLLLSLLGFLREVSQVPVSESASAEEEPSKKSFASAQSLEYLVNLFGKLILDFGNIHGAEKQMLSGQVLKCLIEDVEEFKTQQAHPDILYVQRDNEVIVRAASLDKVIEKLFDIHGGTDPDYNYTVFYTYDYYTDSRSLLEKFIHYYRLLSSNDKQSLVIISVAMFWMKIHHNQLSTDLAFMQKLKEFTDSVDPVPKVHSAIFAYFKSFFQQTATSAITLTGIYQGKKPSKAQDKTLNLKDNANIDIYHLGAEIIAEQVTAIDMELLLAIPPSQFLHKAFTKYDTSVQFHNMVDKFNEWARYTVSEILSKEKLVDRVNTLTFFIDLAKSCVALGNYNAASAIVGGLNHSSITRLKATWEKLSTKASTEYERLETLFDMSMNYKNYREELKSAKNKVIPYLGLFPKDLIAIEEGNDTKTASGLINIEKFRLLYTMVKKIQSYQQPLFNIKSSEPIKHYLNHISENLIEEKEYYAISIKLEPRATTNVTISSTM